MSVFFVNAGEDTEHTTKKMKIGGVVLAKKNDFLLVLFGRLATALVAVAALRIMTTLLVPNEYGQWALLAAFQTFAALFLINPVDQHLFRHAHAWWDEGKLLSHLARFTQYIRLVSIFITIAVGLWAHYMLGDRSDNLVLCLFTGMVVGLAVYFSAWNITLVTLLNVLGFRLKSAAWTIVSVLIGVFFSSLLVMQYPHAISWILGQAFGALVGAFGAWKTLRNHSKKDCDSTQRIAFTDFLNRSTILYFCLPLAAATGLMWLQNTGYRFLVGGVWGAAELAILVVGLGISAQLTAIIESLAMQFLYPYFARRISDARTDHQTGVVLSDLMNVLAPIYAIWAGFNALCAAALLEILTDARYHAAVPFVIFGAMIEFMRCTTNLWSNTSRAIRQTQGLIFPYGLGAAFVWLGAMGAAHFEMGLSGLSMVLVLAGIATCGAMIVMMQRLLPISLDVPRLAIGLSVMSTCFLMALATPVRVIGLYQNIVLLLIGGVVASLLMAAMLWRNPALTRLLSASLRSN